MATVMTGTTYTYSGITNDVLDIEGPGLERAALETTHMGTTTARTFTPGDLYDAGEVTLTVHFSGQSDIPAITGSASNLVIDWAGGASTTTVSAFVIGVDVSASVEEIGTARVTFKCTGATS